MSMSFSQATKYMQDTIPYISRIMKKKKYTSDQLREILKDEEKNEKFVKYLYSELPVHLKLKIKEDVFVNMYLAESKNALKNKKNKKKIYKNEKKDV